MNTDTTVHPTIPNHLVWAIVSTVIATFCCCPFGLLGIVAIVFSTQVNSKLAAGDVEGAQRASNNARIWCIVTTVIAVLGLLFNIGFLMLGGMEAYMDALQNLN